MSRLLGNFLILFIFLLSMAGCFQRSADEGHPALKVFSALGICLAAIFIVFYLVVKSREKD